MSQQQLSPEDRLWIQGLVDRIHDRINEFLESDYERDLQIMKEHIETHHNPVRTWTILGGIAAVFALLIEAVKWLVKKGP